MGTWTICYFGPSIKHVAVPFQHGPFLLYIELEGPSIAKFDSISHGITFGNWKIVKHGPWIFMVTTLDVCVKGP